ncbi:hypothetical protein MSAN_00716100 [Mycena sanguinolenta]|uniref:Uncharacterized protein n=1 Tax=Mycena sanguinolenta TaxID=230812 RepID=A0A8H7DDX3_9AGAR|nr:hypothetical protein MSAN_00716100 [Mycena sanguinolenta]
MSDDTPQPKNRYSIDLSLELEHQLEMESPVSTPAPTQQHHPRSSMDMPFKLPDIDPHRDDLVVLVNTAHTKEAELQDALQHITDKAMALDEALSEARRQTRDDAEAISMLRTKVEESRRGLMRLQAESRRQPAALDTGRANAPSSFSLGPPSSRRASFTPLTGTFAANSIRPNGHNRMSSVSDTNIDTASPPVADPPANRRLSGFFGRSGGSPPREPPLTLRSLSDSSPDELEKLRKEIKTLQSALDETRHELTEANEAREASETCVVALREFIAENNLGSGDAVKLPPLPATTTGVEEGEERGHKKSGSGWGFKLWKADTPNASPVATAPPAPAQAQQQTQPGPGAPLARKLTGFFGSRASVSSTTSSLAPLQTQQQPTPVSRQRTRDSVYSLSDASSLAEPISPTSQMAGAGPDVRVREGTGSGSPELENTGGAGEGSADGRRTESAEYAIRRRLSVCARR